MKIVRAAVHVTIALGILSVWIVRSNRPTPWRGGDAMSLGQEFQRYGLSDRFRVVVGSAKVMLAMLILVGLWFPLIATMASAAMAVLMLGAVGVHVRIADPVRKALPAFSMMLLSLAVVAMNWKPALENRRRLSLGRAG